LLSLFKKQKFILALLIISLFAAESILSSWTAMEYDMKIWFQTGIWMNQGTNIYVPENHLGYPPLWAIWCLISYKAYIALGNSQEFWRFVVKLPMILAQFALAFALAKFARSRFDTKKSKKIFLYAVTWIFFIYIGVLWGQLNLLSALLSFLAFYAVTNKRISLGALSLGLAITLKVYPLIVLPPFLAYVWRNCGKKNMGKFGLFTCAVPLVFTLTFFQFYNWDIVYFLKTIFYWAPVFDVNPSQMQGGCMNIWSFTTLLNVDISRIASLRFLWIPILAVASIYWFKKREMNEEEFILSLISMYILFMISYAWIPEQSFLDPLPFFLLLTVGYRTERGYLYGLILVQALVLAFSVFNWGPFVFQPFLEQFAPSALTVIQWLDPTKNALVWTVRQFVGLIVSGALAVFLVALAKPSIFRKIIEKSHELRLVKKKLPRE
jgi:Gpi18-like mannosyltransferase